MDEDAAPPSARLVLDDVLARLRSRGRPCETLAPSSPPPARFVLPDESPLGSRELADLPADAISAVHTLAGLLPRVFGSALDIVSKRWVVRHVCSPPPRAPPSSSGETSETESSGADDEAARSAPASCLYSVKSASTRYAVPGYVRRPIHHVNLDTWSCTCSQFVWEAFKGTRAGETEDGGLERSEPEDVYWGGCARDGDEPPVCKHLLACTLVDRCPTLFGKYVTEERVSRLEFVEIVIATEMLDRMEKAQEAGVGVP